MIGRCQYRYGIDNHAQCEKMGLGKFCIEHWLRKARYEWRQFKDWLVTLDLDNVNRPELRIDSERYPDGKINWVSFDYGSPGCDPVFSIGWERERHG